MYFLSEGAALRSIAKRSPSQCQRLVEAFLLERQFAALQLRDHEIAGNEIAFQDPLRQRVFNLRLDGALQRPGTVHRVEPRLADLVARIIVKAQSYIALRQPLSQASQLDIDDGSNLLAAQRMK